MKPSGEAGRFGQTPAAAAIGYAAAAAAVALMTLLIHAVPGARGITNVSMLYLLVVIGAALRFGQGAAVVASVLAFVAFDWFFVQPYHTLSVSDPSEWLALLVFLVTASTTGHLTATARKQTEEARRRERETAALAEASWAVAAQLDAKRALAEVLQRVCQVVPGVDAAILTGRSGSAAQVIASWQPRASQPALAGEESMWRVAEEVMREGHPVNWPAPVPDSAVGGAYLPVRTEERVEGVLYLRLPTGYAVSAIERRVVESLANLTAVILERERLEGAQAKAAALAEADRLKTALLSMVSHDFRSPLASIKASATACLQGEGQAESPVQQELHLGIIREADRLNGMVANILALSRLEADAWRPQREEAAPEEVIEAARSGLSAESNRRVEVHIDPHLEDVWLDPVQIGQVVHNLLDNALKYSPEGAPVELQVARQRGEVIWEVRDRGAGLPKGEEDRVFERFYRAAALRESALPGVGIGLSVCRGLVEAHGGRLQAENRPGGGAVFRILMPGRPE